MSKRSCIIFAAIAFSLKLSVDSSSFVEGGDPKKALDEGVKVFDEFAGMIKDSGLDKKFGALTTDFKKFMEKFGPASVFITLLLGGDESKTDFKDEFSKLHNRFDILEKRINELKNHVSKVIFDQTYSVTVLKPLNDIRTASGNLANSTSDFTKAAFKSHCSIKAGIINPEQVFNWLSDLITNQRHNPQFWSAIADNDDLPQLQASVAMVTNDILQLAIFTQLCMRAVDEPKPSDSDREKASNNAVQLMESMAQKLKELSVKIQKQWYLEPMMKDIDAELENAKLKFPYETVDNIREKLTKKYPFANFTVLGFNNPGYADEAGYTAEKNTGEKGLVWKVYEKKGVAVFWKHASGNPVADKEKLDALKTELKAYDDQDEGWWRDNCYMTVDKHMKTLRERPSLKKLDPKRIFVLFVPFGGKPIFDWDVHRETRPNKQFYQATTTNDVAMHYMNSCTADDGDKKVSLALLAVLVE